MAFATGFDGGLVHGLDPTGADGGQLRRDDGGQQQRHRQDLLGQPLAADLHPGAQQALVLAVQRQVIEELVDDQAGEKADIGAPAFEYARRGRGAGQGLGVLDLDDLAHVLEHHVAARALGEAVGDLLGDDIVGLGGQSDDLGVGHRDGLHRDPLGVEEQRRLLTFGLGRAAALVGGDRLGRRRGRGWPAQTLAQGHLLGWGLDEAPLGLLAEDLALEPGDLTFQIGNACHQQGALGDPFGRGFDSGQGWGHGRILPCHRWSRTHLITQAPTYRLDAFQQQLQSRDVELLGTRAPPVPDESAPFQALGPQAEAGAIPSTGP